MSQKQCRTDIVSAERGNGIEQQTLITTNKKAMTVDEALSKIKRGSFHYFIMAASGMILGAVFMETCGVAYIIPISQCDLHLTTSEKGILGAVSFFGMICSSLLWGFLADTQGRLRVIVPTLLIAFVLSLMSSLTRNFLLFATFRGLNGFFISGSSATIYAYLGEFHDPQRRSGAIMGASFVFGIACFVLPLMAFGIVNQEWQFYIPLLDVVYKPWRLFLVVCSLPALIAGIALMSMPESPKFVLGQGKPEKAIQIIHQVNRWNNGEELDIDELVEETESIENRQRILKAKENRFPLLTNIWNQTIPLMRPPYLGPTIMICIMQFWIYYTANGMYIFFNEILNQMSIQLKSFVDDRGELCKRVDFRTNATEIMSAPEKCITKLELETLEADILLEFLYTVGFAIIALTANRIGKFPILFTLLAGCGFGGLFVMFTDIPIVQILCFVLMMCPGMAGNVLSSAAVEYYPTSLRAMAICFAFMFGRLGAVAGSNISAVLFDGYCEHAFYLPSLALIGCAIIAYFVPNIHKKTTEKKQPTDTGFAMSLVSINSMRP